MVSLGCSFRLQSNSRTLSWTTQQRERSNRDTERTVRERRNNPWRVHCDSQRLGVLKQVKVRWKYLDVVWLGLGVLLHTRLPNRRGNSNLFPDSFFKKQLPSSLHAQIHQCRQRKQSERDFIWEVRERGNNSWRVSGNEERTGEIKKLPVSFTPLFFGLK